ncbi:MAG: hypothetical protein LBC75_13205 [Fibromonadaceae bacterium]|jgi:uncharacterized membrane protein YcgQ (UPF0703/DUF1980 family)|nr:hypothetical protein [Fibromonadaceae bacterium]
MKISVLPLLMLLLFCSNAMAQAKTKSFCLLKDRLFVQQVSDIYLNPQTYSDKIVQIEGFFEKYLDDDNHEHYAVFRKTAGCCGDDGRAGFEFVYKKEKLNFRRNEWIMVEAIVRERAADVYLEAISVTKKDKGKAKEFVL